MFGSMVFNEDVMKRRLSTTCYKAWEKCVDEGAPLSLETITAAEAWPYPSYTDLLFSVK